jgi:hypothetical protein
MSRCNGVEMRVRVPQRIPDLRPQLELYARDLKRVLAEEEERTRQLQMANRQLQAYAQDLKSALLAERQQSRELERSYHDTVLRLLGATRCRDMRPANTWCASLITPAGWRCAPGGLRPTPSCCSRPLPCMTSAKSECPTPFSSNPAL